MICNGLRNSFVIVDDAVHKVHHRLGGFEDIGRFFEPRRSLKEVVGHLVVKTKSARIAVILQRHEQEREHYNEPKQIIGCALVLQIGTIRLLYLHLIDADVSIFELSW